MNAVITPKTTLVSLNTSESIQKRANEGKLTWSTPLLFLPARSVLLIFGQSVFALFYYLHGDPSPWDTAGKWWTVWGTIADLGCLSILFFLARREHLLISDLIGPLPKRTILTGILLFFVIAPFSAGGSFLGSWIVYGSWHPILSAGELYGRQLRPWGVLYSLVLWAPIWSVTEEITYNGYLAPRIDLLFGKRWVTLLLIGFWWALQHSFLPLICDWHYIFWRFLAFLPCVLALAAIYLRTRKLAPLIIAHWMMDMIAALTTISFAHK